MATHALEVFDDAEAAAARGAELIIEAGRSAAAARGAFSLAASGGRSPWAMFERLTPDSLPWETTEVFQVDERAAPRGDPDRNLTHLAASLPGTARIRPMPVEIEPLEDGAAQYEALLPPSLDLVHLGLGPDGHTASLVPGDPVLDVDDRRVAATGEYQGHRRMTLTYPALSAARQLLWLVVGPASSEALQKLLDGDRSIPAGRVEASSSVVIADKSAAG